MADLRDKLYSLQYTYASTLNASGFEHDALTILLDLLSQKQNLTPYRRGLAHLLVVSIALDQVGGVDVEQHAIECIESLEKVETGGDEVKIERVEGLILRARGLLGDVRVLKGIREKRDALEKIKQRDMMEEEEIYIPLEIAKCSPPSSPVGGGEKRLMRSAKESGLKELKSALLDAKRAREAMGGGKRVLRSKGGMKGSEGVEREGGKAREV